MILVDMKNMGNKYIEQNVQLPVNCVCKVYWPLSAVLA